MDHDDNVTGAAFLMIADQIQHAVETTTGRRGAQAAALTALLGWAEGHPIDDLARGLGLSHSRTVRVVDSLVESGLAERRVDPADRRQATVTLTRRGVADARAALNARAAVLDRALASLEPDARQALAAACGAILFDSITDRDSARLACRMCDVEACGHTTGHCPSTRAAEQAMPQRPR